MQPLPQRQQEVLQATVRHYVDTTEPVGSQTLVKRFGLQASPATVRSAMGALEQRGLLTQPHTSAGRIPSALGYRHYVDCLLPAPGAAAGQLERELTGLSLQWAAFDDLLLQLGQRLADLTGLMSLITRPQDVSSQLQALRLVPQNDRLLVLLVEEGATSRCLNLRMPAELGSQMDALERWACDQLGDKGGQLNWRALPRQLSSSGALLQQGLASHQQSRRTVREGAVSLGLGGLMQQPEFERSESLRPLLELVEAEPQQVLLSEAVVKRGGVWIGREHPHPALHHCSVVQASYGNRSGGVGQVALIGPMRMAYATARSAVQAVAAYLDRLLN